jgi:hypothetical protein
MASRYAFLVDSIHIPIVLDERSFQLYERVAGLVRAVSEICITESIFLKQKDRNHTMFGEVGVVHDVHLPHLLGDGGIVNGNGGDI